MKRAPRAPRPRLAATPGVVAVEGCVVGDARVEWPRSQTPVSAQILSLPATGRPELNRLRLETGRWPDPARHDEAILPVAFAGAWGVRPGDPEADLRAPRRRFDALIATRGQVRLLIDASELKGWESFAAIQAHASFIKNHLRKVERLAIIVGHDWQHWLVEAARMFLHPEARSFNKSRKDEARKWVVAS